MFRQNNVQYYSILLILQTPEQGAQTSIYLATSDEVKGISGKYFVDCAVSQPSSASQNDDNAKKLWQMSERLTGLS